MCWNLHFVKEKDLHFISPQSRGIICLKMLKYQTCKVRWNDTRGAYYQTKPIINTQNPQKQRKTVNYKDLWHYLKETTSALAALVTWPSVAILLGCALFKPASQLLRVIGLITLLDPCHKLGTLAQSSSTTFKLKHLHPTAQPLLV